MTKRFIIFTCVSIVLSAASVAGAHKDHSSESARCDTWWRNGHFTDSNGDGKPDDGNGSHHHKSSSDINDLRPVANTEIHGQSGHYVVRNDFGYVEVVGGQTYKGPTPQGKYLPGQGGYVQGEVDAGSGTPDADFFVGFFGPKTEESPSVIAADPVAWANGTYGKVCLDAAGTRVVDTATRACSTKPGEC